MNIVDEYKGTESDSDDSSNSASISFVPESATNTPQSSYAKHHESIHHSMNKTPITLEPQLLSGLDLKKVEGNIRRITPLKVSKIHVQEDSSFVQAMANSLIITPESSPKIEQIPIETNISELQSSGDEEGNYSPKCSPKNEKICTEMNASNFLSSDEKDNPSHKFSSKNEKIHLDSNTSNDVSFDNEDDDSPIKIIKKKVRRRIHSDSDESDKESYTKNENQFSRENEQFFQKTLKSSSDEEKKQSNSEQNDFEEEVFSNHSSAEDESDDSSENEQNEVDFGTDSSSENEDHDDLEQTFATCKDKIESNSESDQFSEDSEESYSSSDESGSLFSEDD